MPEVSAVSFFRKKVKTTAPYEGPLCKWCGQRFRGGDFDLFRESKELVGWHRVCAGHELGRRTERRKRQEELAAMIAGKLAPQMAGYRDGTGDPNMVAHEALRIAAAIMDAPQEKEET